ncbi:MAG: hypothetical protein DPW22_10975, partial [Alphaproteobacteria bacterium]|nr:hypothetical protein [Alphaproteobacteria bacterium]
ERDLRQDALAAGFARAIEQGELHLLAQPEVALASNAIVGIEMLPTWKSGEGILGLSQIASAVRDPELRLRFDEWLLRQAGAWARSWRALHPSLRISLPMLTASVWDCEVLSVIDRCLGESAPFGLPAFSLYRALRRVNPAPFLYFLDFGAFSIAGSSPEILVRTRAGRITIRPIAGTRPRGATPHEDSALEKELLADPKERAEHLMLLDLGRNDVGRVARIGSVKVTDQFFIERYSQVMHIVSNVEGDLAANRDALDALAAGFPAGTVSGAPKIRAMEIIDELEKEKRGIYAGAVGYFSAAGNMDTCIVLRTAIVKDGTMYVQAGAGIVADSDPASEQQECINKAKALFRAADEARRFASSSGRGQ